MVYLICYSNFEYQIHSIMTHNAKASIQIQKKAPEVFEAIINPEHMSHYFIASSTGKMISGTNIEWNFPEFPDLFPVSVREIKQNEYISFDWSGGGQNQLVEMFLQPYGENSTIVKVIEKEMNDDEKGTKILIQQTEGWANFLACLKAYLEYGINLRKGAFEFMAHNHNNYKQDNQ